MEENVEKIPLHFLEKKKTHYFGVGAPMPIFEPYISSYNHISGKNVTKLHFLYQTKLVAYEYVDNIIKKSLNFYFEMKKANFLALELQCQFLSLKSALTSTFLV